jgi:predicted transcriptional regulator of viral defense system
MIFQKRYRFTKNLRKTPARDRTRAALIALLGEGRCVVSAAEVAEVAGVSTTSAQSFLNAGIAVGIVQPLKERIPIATSRHFLITERFPRAPSAETITLAALLHVAKGTGETSQAAFAYQTALSLHGLTEVAPTTLHVIKIRGSIHRPNGSDRDQYVPKIRPAKQWLDIQGGRTVFMTLRSADHVAATELASLTIEGIPILVTSPLLTLIDAWMHPDWCAGADRVTDAWRMYWSRQSNDQRIEAKSELAALLVQRTWPGLWSPLSRWAANVVPELIKLPDAVENMIRRNR